ncbi:MAG TPA: hypothetical protein VGI64_09735 [Streptosporangiaceae bacterium]|jgi:hypothetical protein
MTGNESQELRERLGGALEVIEPSPAPLGAVLRQGKTIRRRRRAGIAAGVAVAVGIAAAVPSLLPHGAALQPVSPPRPVITVHPGRSSVPGEIAHGTVNGKPWKVVLGKDASVRSTGLPIDASVPGPQLSAGHDADFSSTGNARVTSTYGRVRRDVTSLAVTLSDETVLTLRPVTLYGRPYVAFQAPTRLTITKVVAYGPYGELGYAVAFKGMVNQWLRSDQPVPPLVTARIATGVADGKTWSITGYSGPAGLCFDVVGPSEGGPSCFGDVGPVSRPVEIMEVASDPGHPPDFYLGRVQPDVARLELLLAGGQAVNLRPLELAGVKYFGYLNNAAPRLLGWAAYDAAGNQLASGSGRQWTKPRL